MTTSTTTGLEQLTGTYDIDPVHTTLEFAAKHVMVSTVRGRFDDFDGTLYLDGVDPTKSRAEVNVRLASVDTRSEQRDAHLRSADFFDVEQYPDMTFKSTRVDIERGEGEYKLYGDLTIKGITREVAFDVTFAGAITDPQFKSRVGFEGHTTISRKEWGLTWNMALEAGGIAVSDKIKINLDVEAVKRES